MSRHSVAEAKNQLPKLIDRALAGEEVTITRRGEPVVRLVPEAAPKGLIMDLEWLDRNRITLDSGTDFSWADIIRQMRDEGY